VQPLSGHNAALQAMAKKADDQAHLEEMRSEIRTLQSEYAKKKDDFDRKQRQRKEAQAELNRSQDRLQVINSELATLKNRAMLTSGDGHQDMADVAKHDYMYSQIGNLLKSRVPIMRAIEEDSAEVDAGRYDGKERQAEDQQKIVVHDTVLVSYVMLGSEDFQVAYRIDSETTVEQLHRDACSYWGCSHNDFCLCRINDKEEAVPLWDRDNEDAAAMLQIPLQSNEILDPAEKAQLHLVRWDDLELFKLQRQKVKEQEQKQDTQAKSSDANTIKTLKHGHGYAVQESVTEPFIEALRPWPGIHNLMKTAKKRRDKQRWTRVKLSDIVLFAVLVALSSCCFVMRSLSADFMLKGGAVKFLAHSVGTEWTGERAIKFEDIRRYEDIWAWLRLPFRHQLFNASSTLNEFYTPVGYLRIRQQKAKRTECPGRKIPSNLGRFCYHIHVDETTQETSSYSPRKEDDAFTNASGIGGRLAVPNPFDWQPSQKPFFNTYGLVQHSYDGAGYVVDYNMSASTGIQFMEDLKFISEAWINHQTRMLAVELTLANYNLGGYVSMTFLLEISPSGAISPTMDVMTFSLYNTWGIAISDGLDIVRWILIVVYVAVIRFAMRTKENMSMGKSRFSYLCSGSGLLDLLLVGLFAGIQVMLFQDRPPNPETLQAFYSYAWWAHDTELLGVLEALLILTCLVRLVTFVRMAPTAYRFFKLFSRAARMLAYFILLIVPVLLGSCFLANTIWSPYIFGFSTWLQTVLTVLLGVYQPFPAVAEMHEAGGGWAIPFLLYFALSMSVFMVHMFLAIMVYSYFEVEMVEGSKPNTEEWSTDQWLDWALWAPVYSKLTGKKAGASRIVGYAEASEQGSDTESEGDSDEEK